MKFKVNIVTFVTLTLLLIGWFLNMASIYILFAVAVIYVIINIMGSIKIEWNYFLFSHCKGESSLKEIALTFDDKAINIIVDKSMEFRLGARGLRSICEAIMLDAMFELPSDEGKKELRISDTYVKAQLSKSSLTNLRVA